jgi:nucleoside-diphosphate-sugar epimerase
MNDTKPRVLVLGGVGMIGRNFVKYLIDHDLCSYIRVADKSMPEIAYFRLDEIFNLKTDCIHIEFLIVICIKKLLQTKGFNLFKQI